MPVLARVGFCVALAMWAAPLVAQEIKSHQLSSLAIDFALDPETANVAAVDPQASSVELYSAAFFDGDTKAKAAPIKVGNRPSAIVYKKYKQRGVFVVGCFNDNHLYLIDAAKSTLLRKIQLDQSGIHHLSCASDPADRSCITRLAPMTAGGSGASALTRSATREWCSMTWGNSRFRRAAATTMRKPITGD